MVSSLAPVVTEATVPEEVTVTELLPSPALTAPEEPDTLMVSTPVPVVRVPEGAPLVVPVWASPAVDRSRVVEWPAVGAVAGRDDGGGAGDGDRVGASRAGDRRGGAADGDGVVAVAGVDGARGAGHTDRVHAGARRDGAGGAADGDAVGAVAGV